MIAEQKVIQMVRSNIREKRKRGCHRSGDAGIEHLKGGNILNMSVEKKWHRWIAIAIALLMLVTLAIPMNVTKASADSGLRNPRITENGTVIWDCVEFGHYPQSSDGNGGFNNDPIKWRVLSVEGNEVLLLADKKLDVIPFHGVSTAISFETSDLQNWLNNIFIKESFLEKEQKIIIDNSYGKLFVPSKKEISNNTFGFIGNKERAADNTDYVIKSLKEHAKGADLSDINANPKTVGAYWLREPSNINGTPIVVRGTGKGYIELYGKVTSTIICVRPMVKINIENSNLWSYAGTVSSDGTVDEEEKEEVDAVSNIMRYGYEDTYKFENLSDKIPLKIYEKFFGKPRAKVLRQVDDGTGGQCFGMITTAMATSNKYNSPEVSTYQNLFGQKATVLSDINTGWKSTTTGINVSDYIKYGQITQYTQEILTEKEKNTNDLSGLTEAVTKSIINNGEPVHISIRGSFNEKNSGHALWVLGVGENNKNQTELIVYDCNYPNKEKKLILNKSAGKYVSWEYLISEETNTIWGTGRPYAEISYTTPADYFILLYAMNVYYEGPYTLIVSTDNTTSKITSGTSDSTGLLSPDSKLNTDIFLPLKIDNANDENKVNYAYWLNIGKNFTLETSNEEGNYSIASLDSGVDVNLPSKSEAKIDINDNHQNSVDFNLSEENFGVSYYDTNKSTDELDTITISGKGDKQVETSQTKEGVIVKGASDLTITVENENEEAVKTEVSDLEENKEYIIEVNEDDTCDVDLKDESVSQPSKPTMPVVKASQSIAAKSFTKNYGNKPFNLNAKAKTKLTYKSSNTKVATVSSSGKVTLNGPGKATITITATATSQYNSATKKITITVKPKKVTGLKAKKGKKRMTVSWKRDKKATGYQITYAHNKKFKKGKKNITISKNKTVKRTIKKLKARKTYYVKVRAYKKVGKTKIYGAYSKVKKVKIR